MMKAFLITTILFFCFQSTLAQVVETRYYNPGQTLQDVKSVFQEFADEYSKNSYEMTTTDKVSENDYTQEFVLRDKSGIYSVLRIRYQFFADKVVCTIVKNHLVTGENEVILLTPDNKNEDLKNYYFVQKNNFVDSIFKHLEILNNKKPQRKAG